MLENERGVREDLVVRESELTQLNEQLVEDSRRDALTGLRNRRALAEDLAILDDVHDHSREAIAFALLDIDHFKAYNDRHGHLAGDQALRGLASIVLGALRETDTAYRFGGEELLILLHTGTASEALRAAERVRSAVQRAAYPHPKGIGGILTVSMGVAVGRGSTGDLIGRADAALYEAKHTGRNRVMLAGQGLATASPVRNRGPHGEEPVPRHLRSLMRITRAGAAGQGPIPVLEALADTIRTDFGFGVVAVNKLDADREVLSVVTVSGDSEAREALQGTSSPLTEWEPILTPERERCGAYWLPAGSYEWNGPGFWTPLAVPTPLADAWHPDDMLLVLMRGTDGEVRPEAGVQAG